MASAVSMVQAAAITSLIPTEGLQDFTIAGFGTPKAAIFIVSGGKTAGTEAAHARLSVGFCDGTRERCGAIFSEDNSTATDDTSVGSSDSVINILGFSIVGKAHFNGWITDGVQVAWDSVTGQGELVTVILLGGSDLSARVDGFTSNSTQDASLDVTAPGFLPDQVLLLTSPTGGAFDGTVLQTRARFGLGVADRGASSVSQGAIGFQELDGVTGGAPDAKISDQYAAAHHNGWLHGIEIANFDASGFDAITREAAGGLDYAYLAVSFAGTRTHDVRVIDTPTATGNNAHNLGHEPALVVLLQTHLTAVNSLAVDSPAAGAIGIGVVKSGGAACTAIRVDEKSSTPTDTGSTADSKAANLKNDDGTTGHVATVTSLDATGVTLNYSSTKASACKWLAWSIGANPPAGGIPVKMNSYRRRRVA